MRRHSNPQGMLDFSPWDPKIRAELEIMNKVLREREEVLDLILKDIRGDADPDDGRPGMSAEQVLRVAITKQRYQLSYDLLYERLSDSINLKWFCKFEFQEVPSASTMQENIKKLKPETLEAVNDALVSYAREKGLEDGKKVRIDSMAAETNIHYPTDARLISDCVGVITRLLNRTRRILPQAGIAFNDRTRVVNKRVHAITDCRKEDARKGLYADLIRLGKEVLQFAQDGIKKLRQVTGTEEEQELGQIMADDINFIAEKLERIIDQTDRRVMKGEHVPAKDKIVSIFEDHTDIIEKGGRETVFGHKVCLSVGKRLVLDALMPRGNPADSALYSESLKRLVSKNDGRVPESVAVDGGFTSQANDEFARELGVKKVYFSKPSRRGVLSTISAWQRKALRGFRAGIEGILSTMMRVRGLTRCIWKGWESFQSYIWASIISENLLRIARDLAKREAKAEASG